MDPKKPEAARGLADQRAVAIQRRECLFLRSHIRSAETLADHLRGHELEAL